MRYFKIIQGNEVVDVSFTPMKWSVKYGQMVGCSVAAAQFMQGTISEKAFRDGWMRHTNAPETVYEEADVVEIDEVAYNDIYVTLANNEKIEIDPEEPQIYVAPKVTEVKEDRPPSIAEMRQIIHDQQEQIEALKEMFTQVLVQQ